jgi:hypothetical protein
MRLTGRLAASARNPEHEMARRLAAIGRDYGSEPYTLAISDSVDAAPSARTRKRSGKRWTSSPAGYAAAGGNEGSGWIVGTDQTGKLI